MRLKADEAIDSAIASWVQILFNGSDITNICFIADDKEGWAGVYIATEVRQGVIPTTVAVADENGEPISTIIKGKVEFILKPDAPEAARLEFERRKQQEQ